MCVFAGSVEGQAVKRRWPCRLHCGVHPAVVLFFVTVNQVLVRLWARVSELVGRGVVDLLTTDH
jgi:hypothetical protein